MKKEHVLGSQSTLTFGPGSPAAPHPENHCTDTNLHWVLPGCCLHQGRHSNLAKLLRKGSWEHDQRAGESWRTGGCRWRDAGGTCAPVSMRDGAGGGLLCRAAECVLLGGATRLQADYPAELYNETLISHKCFNSGGRVFNICSSSRLEIKALITVLMGNK